MLLAVVFQSGMQNQWRFYPTHANGQPAFVVYRADAIQVVILDSPQIHQRQIAEVTAFLNPELATSFGFPLHLP